MTGQKTKRPRRKLPPETYRMGGEHFRSNQGFMAGARKDARMLVRRAGLSTESRVLDWGCGAGRLVYGVRQVVGEVRDYHGVDVQERLIAWAQKNLTDPHTRFTLVDQHNERYNPAGSKRFDIPADDGSVDVFYAYSVFSHMLAEDVAGYSHTIGRILAPEGKAFLTAFVADGVPDCVENPEDFRTLEWEGPLHCVRFDRVYFEGLLRDAGLVVEQFVRGQETDGQSSYVLSRAPR